jgi:hypothetical protein
MRCSNNINTITIIDLMNNRTLFLLMLIETGCIESLPAWTVLDPYRYESADGATLLKESDHSLFSAGKRPEKDTYTVSVRTSLPRLTAIRIDLIADDRLPSSGPDRQENGNLHLNELIFSAKPLGARSSLKRVTLRAARADFNQTNWEISKSIDGNPGTAWGIHPRVGQSHSAIYMLEKPLSSETRFELIFKLAQFHGDGHLVGHFRLGAIDVEEPDTQAIDPRLQRVSTTLSGKRTREQLLELAGLYMNWSLKRVMSTLPERKRLYCGTNQFTAVGGHRPAETPRAIHILARGSVQSPGDLAEPGTISCISGLSSQLEITDSSDEVSRRAALARWLTDKNNVLTWRSIVNRIWHFHFGRGLVATPNDFGLMGATPTHPELLDWLTVKFLQNGGSLKWLHRIIVTSSTYRQSSAGQEEYARMDNENRYLWRMNRRVLDAESIRDTILQHSGKIDLTMGGPPIKQFIDAKVFGLRAEADYRQFDVDDPGYYRRNVYRYICRTMPDPFMNAMDCPDASQRAPIRNTSITALQAAAMLNDPFLVRQCEHLGQRLAELKPEMSDQLDMAFQLLFGRSPETAEIDAVVSYAAKHGMANACRVLLNTNEFLFVD